MSPKEQEIFLAELDGLESLADTVKATCYRLRVKLSGVSTPDIPTGAEEAGLSLQELQGRTQKFRRRFKKTA